MPIPTQTDAFRITLDLLSDGKAYSRKEVFRKAREELNITADEEEIRLASGTPAYIGRVDWAIVYLHRGLLLDRVSRGVYQINDRGLEIAKTGIRGSEFSRWLNREIAEKIRGIRARVLKKKLSRIVKMSPRSNLRASKLKIYLKSLTRY